jgi:hypothetical protein
MMNNNSANQTTSGPRFTGVPTTGWWKVAEILALLSGAFWGCVGYIFCSDRFYHDVIIGEMGAVAGFFVGFLAIMFAALVISSRFLQAVAFIGGCVMVYYHLH